jgi:hypothetical protein
MKGRLPSSSLADVLVDDDEVCEIRWCLACERGQRTKLGGRMCEPCKGKGFVVTVRKAEVA